MIEHLTHGITLHGGDCRDVLAGLADGSVDSVVTDPPYGLEFMGKDWDSFRESNSGIKPSGFEKLGQNGTPSFAANRRNQKCPICNHWAFSSHKCVCGGWKQPAQLRYSQSFGAFSEAWAREVYRVLKPGGHLVAFGGTRTYHRLACAIEDAGFEIRDQLQWIYGSGFPKSLNLGNGYGTALKPACEPICLARKPLSEATVAANVLRWGTGAINVDGCRVETDTPCPLREKTGHIAKTSDDVFGERRAGTKAANGSRAIGETAVGRWPANIIHDGSDEVMAGFPVSDARGGDEKVRAVSQGFGTFEHDGGQPKAVRNDTGSAARFFYTAKADADDRLGSKHPTVKPVDLMQWLCRLVTPKGGTILDPFAGTGTTGEAAFREGFKAVLIEREDEYQADIRRRMALCWAGPDERRRESIKARGLPRDDGPLFAAL